MTLGEAVVSDIYHHGHKQQNKKLVSWTSSKLDSCASEDTIKRVKKSTDGENFAIHISNKVLLSRIYNILL